MKEQERQAIEKIRKIVEELDDDSYVGNSMAGVLEIVEQNIAEKEKNMKYMEIIDRAVSEGMKIHDSLSAMMDIESADKKSNIRLDDWVADFRKLTSVYLYHDSQERRERKYEV